MAVQLPPVTPGKNLDYFYFPTLQQLFVYRNWNMVAPDRLAMVLNTDEETVLAMAADMGLPAPDADFDTWLRRGYVTIIRANWHLLPYDQLTQLLGWTLERLAFVLREEDFLDIKLGGNIPVKPDAPPLHYRPLTAEEQAKTAVIRQITEETLKKLPRQTVAPFDFSGYFAAFDQTEPVTVERADKSLRMVHSYCALYGDVFLDDALMDASFPEELLESYAKTGINAVWTQAVLYSFVPFPFDPSVSAGYEKRLAGANRLVQKLKKHGIDLVLYLNEPRAMPNAFFERYPELKGAQVGDYSSLCLSQPAVQDYLRDSVAYLVREVPDLGGIFCITASENLTNCHSIKSEDCIPCQRCAAMTDAQAYAQAVRLIHEGATSVRPDFPVIAYTWAWNEAERDCINLLPQSVQVLCVSESGVEKTIGGVVTREQDYSISIVGPGEKARQTWTWAKERGLTTVAKVQVNNSWEMSAVPYLPVFEQVYTHIRRLLTSGLVDNLMMAWSLGGGPSLTMQMVDMMMEEHACTGEIPPLDMLYERLLPGCDVETLKEAFHCFSQAFDAYPFHLYTAYFGPQNRGPANLLWPKPTGFEATMTCLPYDDLDKWRHIFPRDTFRKQWKLLSEEWGNGLPLLKAAAAKTPLPLLTQLVDIAEACYCYFRSAYLQVDYVMRREDEDCTALIREEEELALRLYAVMCRNATIAFEATNHYFFTRTMLLEKVVNCRALLSEYNL